MDYFKSVSQGYASGHRLLSFVTIWEMLRTEILLFHAFSSGSREGAFGMMQNNCA